MDKVVLFDIDDTLMKVPRLDVTIFPDSLKKVYGTDVRMGELFGGMTDQGIIIRLLEKEGMERREIMERMEEAKTVVSRVFAMKYPETLRECVLPGARELLSKLREEGFRLGLLTGNMEEMAWEKMRRAGLDGIFEFGGFGSDAIERNDLLPIAMERAEKILGKKVSAGIMVVIGTRRETSSAPG